jgi:hypothetical protein
MHNIKKKGFFYEEKLDCMFLSKSQKHHLVAQLLYYNNGYCYTLAGQKYFLAKIFPYIFHIKPLIFVTFSWSHAFADFHEIFTFNSRIIRVYFNIFM